MSNPRLILALLAGAAIGAVVFEVSVAQPAGEGAPAATRVGVCDVVQIFNNYEKSKVLSARLTDQRNQIKAEDDKRRKEIDGLQMELEALKEGSPEHEKRLQRLQELTIQLQVWQQFQQSLIMRRHHQLTQELYEEILRTIDAVAKERGFQVVLYAQRTMPTGKDTPELLRMIELRKVVYSAPGLDLTDTVLARLNESYRGAGG